MNEIQPLVLDLLRYIEQIEKAKFKPSFTVPAEIFAVQQHELKGLPGVAFNVQASDEELWMRVDRLSENPPPQPDSSFTEWVTLSKSADKRPELKTEIVVKNENGEISTQLLSNHPEIQSIFDQYVDEEWTAWAASERPRRKTISFYKKLFTLQNTLDFGSSETPLELIWGIGNAIWKIDSSAPLLKHPLLTQSCEITLNQKTQHIEVRPRDVAPHLEINTFAQLNISGIQQLESVWKESKGVDSSYINPFEPSTFEEILKAAVSYLDSNGAYQVIEDNQALPAANENLLITDSWVLFVRKRSANVLIEDIQRFMLKVDAGEDIPEVIRRFVQLAGSEVQPLQEQSFRGLSSSESPENSQELYFPLPYNNEQVSIIQKLEHSNGVVVQGPPGTGKTHTIANIICHYLANGKRVLITSKGEPALNEVLGKLPEEIQSLAVALLANESDGMKKFEHSIQTIASRVASFNSRITEKQIVELEGNLNQLHAQLAYTDHSIASFAKNHIKHYSFQGKEILPEEVARIVIQQQDEHQWMNDDLSTSENTQLPFGDAEINELRRARIQVGDRLHYLYSTTPVSDDFPESSQLLELHRDLIRAHTIESNLQHGTTLNLTDSTFETFEVAKDLIQFLELRQKLMKKLEDSPKPIHEAFERTLNAISPDDPLLTSLQEVGAEIWALDTQRKNLVTQAIKIPQGAEQHPDFCEALARLVAGKNAFSFPFGKSDARKQISQITVRGQYPKSKNDWELVQKKSLWSQNALNAVASWNAVAGEFNIPPQTESLDTAFRTIVQLQSYIDDRQSLAHNFNAKLHTKLLRVFGQKAADRLCDEDEKFICEATESLQVHVDKNRLAYTMNRIGELIQKLESHDGKIVSQLREFFTKSLGDANIDESTIRNTWISMQSELTRIASLRPAFEQIARSVELIESAGAIRWAQRIRTETARVDSDPVIPPTWHEAWLWRCAIIFLNQIDNHHKLRQLFSQRQTLIKNLSRTYKELIAEKTWIGVFRNSPPQIRQALQAYLQAFQKIRHGHGVKAVSFRKSARDAMQHAYQAVPCWILPEWRVSESIPSELGLFDLVVIDEASQSDISCLPALLRGKKLLVVGDDKQVSPSAVGVAEEQIQDFKRRFLAEQPHKDYMRVDMSIYNLARVVFAGNDVMLKEHFRCVPAIIEYSNREFYQGEIIPLRIPKANERLDPPLIDVFVKGGSRDGDVNHAEAMAIVNEISAILADESLVGRTIGVVTLHGHMQDLRIRSLIDQQISQIDIVARKIIVGTSPVFQGKERDIMLISMVNGSNNRATQKSALMEQYFNVAGSRARDRMYLFRSVDHHTFGADTLNGSLMQHFKEPFRQDAQAKKNLRDRCQSPFEEEMFDELTKREYRVETQVKCGPYSIDLVVEGNEGRRLAIECDGDRYHGADKWSDDMARQRVLERAGWTFWRCFASSFVLRKEEVMKDLLQTFDSLGIGSIGSESVDNSVWVHSREVDPFAVENDLPVA